MSQEDVIDSYRLIKPSQKQLQSLTSHEKVDKIHSDQRSSQEAQLLMNTVATTEKANKVCKLSLKLSDRLKKELSGRSSLNCKTTRLAATKKPSLKLNLSSRIQTEQS